MTTQPPAEEPIVARALQERPDQRFVGDRDLTRWETAVGAFLAGHALRHRRHLTPPALIGLVLVAGLAVASGLTALAGGVYDSVAEGDGVALLDRPVLEAVKGLRTPVGNAVVAAYSSIAGPVGMPLLAAAVAVGLALAWRQWMPLLLVAVAAAGSLTLTVVGKAVVGRVRPPLADAVPPYELSASFPSGHTLNATVLAGVVAYLLVRRQHRRRTRTLTIVLAVVFALLVGASRVYLGHHWPTDVLVAWALGLGWLTIVITAHRLLLTVRARPAPPRP